MPSSSAPCSTEAALSSRGSDICSRSPPHPRTSAHSNSAHGLAAPTRPLALSTLGLVWVCLVRLCVFWGFGVRGRSGFTTASNPEPRCPAEAWAPESRGPVFHQAFPSEFPAWALGAKGNQIKVAKGGGGRQGAGGQIQEDPASICIIILLATMGTQDIYLKAVMLI